MITAGCYYWLMAMHIRPKSDAWLGSQPAAEANVGSKAGTVNEADARANGQCVGVQPLELMCAQYSFTWSRGQLSQWLTINKHCCSLAVLDPGVGHTMDVLSPFISVLYYSDCLFHGESCLRTDVVHPGRVWSSLPACTWHCSLRYLFLQATPLFPHGVTIVC